MFSNPISLVISFVLLWIGSGLALSSLERLSQRLRSSSFALSFLLLGIFTSLSELSVGVSSIIDKKPEIFVGDLLGASLVIVLLIIPLMAILHNGIKIDIEESDSNFVVALLVICLPMFLALDKRISFLDSFLMIGAFVLLAFFIQRRKSVLLSIEDALVHNNKIWWDVARVVFGALLIFASCKVIVDGLIYYSALFNVSPFVVSLITLSIGTNIPELSVLIQSYFSGRKKIALGDYIGSASFNTFLMGMLTMLNEGAVTWNNGIRLNLFLLPIGCIVFYFISRKKVLSRGGGFLLLGLYALFVLIEIF